jgi:hypothetical protein
MVGKARQVFEIVRQETDYPFKLFPLKEALPGIILFQELFDMRHLGEEFPALGQAQGLAQESPLTVDRSAGAAQLQAVLDVESNFALGNLGRGDVFEKGPQVFGAVSGNLNIPQTALTVIGYKIIQRLRER